MSNYVLLGACFLIGMLLRKSGRLPDNAAASLNGVIVNISLPALTLSYIHKLDIDTELILPAVVAWVLFALGCIYFWLIGRTLGLPKPTTGALMLTGGLGNTSFIGLPMIEAFYGSQFLGIGILVDQVGSYLVLSTLGVLVASIYASSEDKPDIKAIVMRIITFTPFQALIVAIILKPVEYPAWFEQLLGSLAATVVPLALVSVGYQLRISHLRGKGTALASGLLFKLVFGPALILVLFSIAFAAEGQLLRVTIFEAAMPPMIGASIVALQYDLDPPLVTLMVGIGIPLAFITLPAWWYVLNGF